MGHGWGRGWGCSARDRGRWKQRASAAWDYGASSGNRAFDEYRDETLRRLEDEQREFRSFLERLRLAKDRAEFDQFMSDRKNRPAESGDAAGAPQT